MIDKIKDQLTEEFPGYQFSVNLQEQSTLVVNILNGPIDLGTEYRDVNPYWLNSLSNFYRLKADALSFLERVKEIAEQTSTAYYKILIGEAGRPYSQGK